MQLIVRGRQSSPGSQHASGHVAFDRLDIELRGLLGGNTANGFFARLGG